MYVCFNDFFFFFSRKRPQTKFFAFFVARRIVIGAGFLPNDGREKTLRFTFPGNFVSSYASFILQKPSEIAIETLSDCKCWRITYDDLQDCYLQIEKGNRMGRISAEYLYITSSSREINMLVKSPEQQYLELLESSPEWFQHIPLKHVASYLGITPQALNRIRARIF